MAERVRDLLVRGREVGQGARFLTRNVWILGSANANGGPGSPIVRPPVVPEDGPAFEPPPPLFSTTTVTTAATTSTAAAPIAQGSQGRGVPGRSAASVGGREDSSIERQRLRLGQEVHKAAAQPTRPGCSRIAWTLGADGLRGRRLAPNPDRPCIRTRRPPRTPMRARDFSWSRKAFVHRLSLVPWKYQFEPLSARSNPYVFIACSTTRASALNPLRPKFAFRRNRAPIGGYFVLQVPASCRAGQR